MTKSMQLTGFHARQRERAVKVYYATSGNPEFPMIRLMGKWLESAGFDAGDLIKVHIVAPGELVIKRLDNIYAPQGGDT